MIINGDCIEEMQKLIDEGKQVDSVVTDPPYHLTSIVERFGKEGSAPAKDKDGAFQRQSVGFMGKEWDGGDIAFRPDTWKLAYDLLKPGGHLLAFSASRNYHRMAVAIEDAGFEIRDQIMWIYGSGFPKSLNLGKGVDRRLGNERIKTGETKTHARKGVAIAEERTAIGAGAFGQEVEEEITVGTSEWEGWGTALKPAHEPIVMARKPLSEKSIVDNVLEHRTGGINIDGCRIPYGEGNEPIPQLAQGKTKVNSTKTMFDGQSLHKSNTEAVIGGSLDGRYPANVMHGGLETEWARYFYCPKTASAEKNKGLENFTAKPIAWGNQAKAELKRGNLDFAADGDGTKHNKVAMRLNTHPTVKPQELMKYLCRLVTPKGGTVLDPFMGSGSTGMAAKDEGFDFIGIEKEQEYFDIAEARIKTSSPLMEFFS